MPPVEVERTWLEMESSGSLTGRAQLPEGVTLRREQVTPAEYRELYGTVGRDYHWRDRLAWTEAQLLEHLASPAIAVWVMRAGGSVRGYFELARHDDGSVEIAYFGLMPNAIGSGLGRALLTAAVEAAWGMAPAPTRVWLHTCTLDHPAALANYLARGFRVTRRERYTVDVPAAQA